MHVLHKIHTINNFIINGVLGRFNVFMGAHILYVPIFERISIGKDIINLLQL